MQTKANDREGLVASVRWQSIGVVSATVGAAAVLMAVAPAPGALPALLWEIARSPQEVADAQGPETVALTLVATLGWFALAWLCAAMALVGATALPGRAGALADTVSGVLVPAAARRLLAAALGVTLVTGVGAGTAAASPGTPAPPPAPIASLNLDWPTTPAEGSATAPRAAAPPGSAGSDGPRAATPRAAPPGSTATRSTPPFAAPRRSEPSDEVVVQRGDSLWSIAARHLGSDATDEEIAGEWPRWWAANRHVVGDDPDLIKPGQRLLPPGAR
jgi:hypothetical protein